MLKKMITLTIIIAFTLTFLQNCDATEPPSNKTISLTFEDASSTEVWLNLRTENISIPQQLNLLQNDTLRYSINLTSSDTTLYIDSLLPNQTYKFKSTVHSITQTTNQLFTSNILHASTMDTTSHNFTWQTFTFGGVNGSSVLNDVAIISENDIWCVGEINIADTSQNGYTTYNAVHWDGNKWELKRIMFYINQDQPSAGKTSSPCEASFVFNDNKIAITSNVQTAIFNTNSEYSLIKMGFAWVDRFTINALWGTSSTDFYVVGNNGNIAHYSGTSWEKIESGTDVDLVDIWGSSDGKNIWICGNENFKPTVLLKIKNNKSEILYNSRDNLFSYNFNRLSGDFTSVWTNRSNILYILTAYDLYRIYKENISNPIPLWKNTEQIATRKARGTESNNIFTVGENGELSHYNGISWKTYDTLFKRFKEYKSISVKKSIIVAVGKDYINGIEDKAIITITKK